MSILSILLAIANVSLTVGCCDMYAATIGLPNKCSMRACMDSLASFVVGEDVQHCIWIMSRTRHV